ncbi:MAG: hypothetical protein AMXMBFR48_09100 [Ignavibacteriales bacterium]
MRIEIKVWEDTLFTETAKLLRQSMPGYPFPDFLFREKLTGDPDFRPGLVFASFEGNSLTGFIMGVVRKRESGPAAYVKLIGVRPGYERKGIGTMLLATLEEAIKKKGLRSIRVFESYPNYFMPGIDANFHGAIAFFESSGYVKFNETINMEVFLQPGKFPVEDDIKRLSEKGIFFRRAVLDDKSELLPWINARFPEWKGEVSEAFRNNPVTIFVARNNGRIIGFSAFEANNKGTGWFGPMGTDTTFRGLSIGRVLLRTCLNEMQKVGFAKAVIPWVGPAKFYEAAAGARIDKFFRRYEKNFN